MKRIIYLLPVLCLFSVFTYAQQTVNSNLENFIKEIKALESEHVSCEIQGFDSFINENIGYGLDNGNSGSDIIRLVDNLNNLEWLFLVVQSDDREGYNMIYDLLDKYDVMEAEEVFGIPLAVNTRENSHQSTIYLDENNSLIVIESDFEIRLIYTNCNIVNVLTHAMRMLAMGLDDYLGEFVNNSYETLTHVGEIWETENESTEEKQQGSDYDFFNMIRLKRKLQYADVVELITPEDVAEQYMIKNFPKEKWLLKGYPENVKEIYKQKYPGGTPAILYAVANGRTAYKRMTEEFDFLFNLALNGEYNGFKVVQQSKRNGRRYVQLYGKESSMVTVVDLPEKNCCKLLVNIGSGEEFAKALNIFTINEETDNICRKCIITIDEKGMDIRMPDNTADETKSNGLRFNFRLKEMFLK